MTTPVTQYFPTALDALFNTFEGVEADDIGSTAIVTHDPTVMSGKFVYKPLQDEILNNIDKILLSGAALRIRNETGGTLTYTATPLLYVSGFKNNVISGDSGTQLSSCTLYGVRSTNSLHWRLYWSLTDVAGTRTVNIYRDSAKTILVASGSRSGDGAITLAQQNSSGITGTITVTYSADDTDSSNYMDCNLFLVTKSNAGDNAKVAQLCITANLANNTNGLGYGEADVTGFDTSGWGSAGDPVYTSATVGAVTKDDPNSLNAFTQMVGFVTAKDATAGSMRLFPAKRMVTRYIQQGGMRASADLAKTSNVTLANITGMSINLTAGQGFIIRGKLFTSSTVNGGVKVGIGGTASFTSILAEGKIYNGATLSTSAQVTAAGTLVNATVASDSVEFCIAGVCNAAGTLTIQGAQNVSHSDTTTFKKNSHALVENG